MHCKRLTVLLGNPHYCVEEMRQYYADHDVIAELEAECDADLHYVNNIYSVDFDGVTQYSFHKAGQEEELICQMVRRLPWGISWESVKRLELAGIYGVKENRK